MKILIFAVILFFTILNLSSAKAALYDKSGNKVPDVDAPTAKVNWRLLTYEEAAPWRGAQLMSTYAHACSSVLVDTGRGDDQRAYLLTAGHCSHIKTLAATDVFSDVETMVSFTANFYFESRAELVSYKGNKLVYLTEYTTDLGLFELDDTIAYFKGRGFNFFKLSKTPPKPGTIVVNVGLPVNYMSKETSWYHYSECKTGKLVSLKEEPFSWDFSYRHNCSGVGGMSGSPLIDKQTNEIVGIFNTVVDDETTGKADCTDSRPCEVDLGSKSFPEYNYAQRVDILAQCFDSKGDFDLSLESCKLPKKTK